jgi:hypothetical protein
MPFFVRTLACFGTPGRADPGVDAHGGVTPLIERSRRTERREELGPSSTARRERRA